MTKSIVLESSTARFRQSLDIPNFYEVVLIKVASATRYSTITAALAAAISGDIVLVGPGVYNESFTIPSGVVLAGVKGKALTSSIAGALATGTRVTLGDSSILQDMHVELPTDASPAITYAGAGKAYVDNVQIKGNGGSGVGISNTGTGVFCVENICYTTGACDAVFLCSNGKMNIAMPTIEESAGVINDGLRISGGLADVHNFRCYGSSVVDGVEVGAGTLEMVTGNIRNATNAVRVSSNSADVSLFYTFMDSNTKDILIDPGVTSAMVRSGFGRMDRRKIDYSPSLSPINISFLDDSEGDLGTVIQGEMAIGRPENGFEMIGGEGDSYTRGMVVKSTDNTASPTLDGGNFTDLSSSAASASGSSFGFQGVTANHTILIGSSLSDASDKLKHWGIKISQIAAAVEVTPKSFAFEIWNGSAWVEINVMATHSSLFYRYANEIFIRANSSEHIRYGITPVTTWAKKTIDSVEAFWSRIRIKTTVTTAPTFEQFKLSTNRFEVNANGYNTYHGSSRFRVSLQSSGNVFGESGAVLDSSFAVGSGGLPTGWTHASKSNLFNGSGDAIYFQFILPRGVDTSHPLLFRVVYFVQSTFGVDGSLILSALPLEVAGTLEADPSGGLVPVERSLANTKAVTADAGQTETKTIATGNGTKLQEVHFLNGIDISDCYEGDLIVARVELDNDGSGGATGADIAIMAVEVSGVQWTNGARLGDNP